MEYIIHNNISAEQRAPFVDLRNSKQKDVFIAETDKIISSLLASNLEITSLYITTEFFESKLAEIKAHHQEKVCDILIAEKEEMEQVVGYPLHQGIMAEVKIPEQITVEALIEKTSSPHLFVVLEEIADAENMGSIIRTAAGLGAQGIIISKRSINPWIRRSVRVSMGTIFDIPIIVTDDLNSSLQELRKNGIKTFATYISDSAETLWDVNFRSDSALIFGSEGHGLTEELIGQCDALVQIPMSGAVDSLNVSMAVGLCLYEVNRQRGE